MSQTSFEWLAQILEHQNSLVCVSWALTLNGRLEEGRVTSARIGHTGVTVTFDIVNPATWFLKVQVAG